MAKKIILALIMLILIAVLAICFISNDSVDLYIDGENVSVNTFTLSGADVNGLNEEICNSALSAMNDTSSNSTTLRNEIKDICRNYGMEDPEIKIDSSIGPDQIPVIVYVDGTSMLPTLNDGQSVLMNKSKDVHVGDIVVAESDEYGGIIKRVADVKGDSIYLVSDNKNVNYEYVDGILYEVKGITTWVDISDINGVVIGY